MKRILALASLALLLAGCAVKSVSLSSISADRGQLVRASVSRLNLLFLSPLPQERLELLLAELDGKCQGAGVTGITTKTSEGWVLIGMVEKTEASGYCRLESEE